MTDGHDHGTGRTGETPPGPFRVSDLLHLTSRQNARVKSVARLSRRRERDATGTYLVEGPNAVAEAVADGVVQTVYVREDDVDDHDLAGWVDDGIDVVVVTDEVLAKLTDATSPQGVAAVARQVVTRVSAMVGEGVLVVLEEPNDPGNLGTVIRTADAAGCAGVVVTGDAVDLFHPKVVRATAGSLTHLPVGRCADVAEVVAACSAVGQRVVGLDADGEVDVFTLEQDAAPVAVVLGTESHGLSAGARAAVDGLVAIPQFGRAESLNLAVAAAVTIYAAARGRAR